MTAASLRGTAALAHAYVGQFPAAAARHLEAAPVTEAAGLLQTEPAPVAAAVLERVAPNVAAELLLALEPDARRKMLAAVDPARASSALAWLDESGRAAVLEGLDERRAHELRSASLYPAATAGRLMDPRAVGVRSGMAVRDALARLRGARRRQVSELFMMSDDGRLVGRIALQVLAAAAPSERLDDLVEPASSVADTATEEEVVERFTDRHVASLPVVDFEGRLVGVIRHDTLARSAQEDVAGDIQAMVGASREERALSPAAFAVRARLPWLQINLATAFLAASVVGLFESTIAQFTALAVLLPVVAGQSGNTGAQALAVTMRGLALREIRVSQWPRVTRKEATVAFVNGVAVALTTSLGVFVWSGSGGLALVIGVSMVISMVAAGLAGVVIPIVLTTLNQDPAQSSSIVLTTVTDVVGFSSFLGIATLLSSML